MVGSVKIMKRDQSRSDAIQIGQLFDALDPNYCSVGTSLDYYQRLNEILEHEPDNILLVLRDVVHKPALQMEFQDEEAWSVSLFCDNSNPSEFLADATAILTGHLSELPDIDEKISFLPGNWSTPVVFSFASPPLPVEAGKTRRRELTGATSHLPRRINVIIGRNGSGKSTLLSRMARVGFASPSDRATSQIQALGALEPSSVGFTKIIAISYSPFDNFWRQDYMRKISNKSRSTSGEVGDDTSTQAFATSWRMRAMTCQQRPTAGSRPMDEWNFPVMIDVRRLD